MNLFFNRLLETVLIPFRYFIETTGRLYWVYLLSAALIGGAAVLYQNFLSGNFSWKKSFREILDFSHWKTVSSQTDFKYYFIESILFAVFFSWFVLNTAAVSVFIYRSMFFFFGSGPKLNPNLAVNFIYTVIFLLAYDYGKYTVHRWLHAYPILWEFHKFHHSAESLNPITVYRVHPVESILLNSAAGLFSGIVSGVFIYVYPGVSMFSFLGVNFGIFLFHLYSNLRHSQVWISFPAWLSRIVLSPAQHQIHHSSKSEHAHSNFGVTFAFWDFFGKSLYIPERKEELRYGLPKMTNSSDYTDIFRIFWVPFYKVYGLLFKEKQN
ncbi:MAG TPA: sterol desaturase family protein [Leptospiraceae bacterium]|nr:sterol desaturase family protein [Leptospiraceae bacterium]